MSVSAQAEGEQFVAELADPLSLRSPVGGPRGLLLDIAYVFIVEGIGQARFRPRSRVVTRMYEYRLLDHHHKELLVYHWQPGPGARGPDHPHLHISAALHAQVDAVTRREIGLDKLHVETGRVSLEAVIRMLITEFRVALRRHDWRETLDRTRPDLNASLDTR
ncbi:MAG: hypothetical protein H0T72_13785 [Chloroflexia bacterium]|nr:hypothetical protein [Chloroflexia bacterium]